MKEALASLGKFFGIDLDAAVPAAAEEASRRAASSAPKEGDEGAEGSKERAKGTKAEKDDPFGAGFEGLVPNLRRRYEEGTLGRAGELEPYRALRPCPSCQGERLKAAEPRRPRQGTHGHRVRQPADLRSAEGVRQRSSSPIARR